MSKWLKWGLGLALVGLFVAQHQAEAVKPGTLPPSQYPFETILVASTAAQGLTNSDSVGNLGPGRVIYGFRLIADTAGDSCALIDAATVGTVSANRTQGTFIDDLVQDTDERTQDSDWPAPYVLVTDLSVSTNGLCIVYVDPQP